MFPEMRRKKQLLSPDRCEKILIRGSHGVLALQSPDGYPYALPLSYVYHEGRLLFHGATAGKKVECLRHCDKASFCVVSKDDVCPEHYTTHFESVIAFGRVRMLTDLTEETIRLLIPLAAKYRPAGTQEQHLKAIQEEKAGLCVFVMDIDHLTGKQAIELV